MNISDEVYEKIVKLVSLIVVSDTQGACDIGGHLEKACDLANELYEALRYD